MRLLLVRHGETEGNAERRVMGHNDRSLSPRGRQQARAVALALRREAPVVVYTSPLVRALETAEIIGRVCAAPVAPLAELKEADAGELDGLTPRELWERYPGFMERWRRDAATAVMPGGESLAQLQARAWAAVESLAQGHRGQRVVAVSHNFTVQTILCSVLGMPLAHFRRLRVDLGSLTAVEFGRAGAVVRRLNDRCHLASCASPAGG